MGDTNCRYIQATRSWCQALPKAELHAHLSGSIRHESIRRLLNRPGHEEIKKRAEGLLDPQTGQSLKKCFELFSMIHDLITEPATLRELVLEILQDFADENIVYLELRTTPRSSKFFSAELYLWTVLKAVHEYHAQNPEGLVCRVLVSISRHLPVEDAKTSVAITEEFISKTKGTPMSGLIVGIELSGNPNKGSWQDFEPVLKGVRSRLQLPISLHFGEVLNNREATEMLDFKPDRVGHAVQLSDSVLKRLLQEEKYLGVEVCITSNLVTSSVASVSEHPVVKKLIPANHPFCVCTDDPGIFDTTLSREYGFLVKCMNLSRQRIAEMALTGLELWFCKEPDIKRRVIGKFFEKLKQACDRGETHECSLVLQVHKHSSPLKAAS